MLHRMRLPDGVVTLARRVRAAGGRALLIGGAVRDRLLGQEVTDFDVEVYRLAPDTVARLAAEVGTVRDVGRAFGVLEVRSPSDGAHVIHLSLPRRDAKIGRGHRGFAVSADLGLSPVDAAHRRDFTMNAIAEDPLTGELLDPFNGRADLESRVLRVVDARTFGDDPLRVLRGAVFAAQFGLSVDPSADGVIRATVPTLRELPRERVGGEWRKLLLRPERPSVGLRLLMDWGVFALLHPEFAVLPRTPQNPQWHPEGDVWTHTLMAVDEAAALTRKGERRKEKGALTDDERWRVVLAALCHDLGKTTTTAPDVRGTIRSTGHDAAVVQPTRRFLHAIAADGRTADVVVRVVREHLVPLRAFTRAARGTPLSDGALRQLARRLHPATIFLLTLVADADHRGRGPFYGEQGRTIPAPAHDAGAHLRERADRLGVLLGPPAPVLHGADLVALGLSPGPDFGAVLRRAEELRDERGLDRVALLERLRGAATADDALRALRGA